MATDKRERQRQNRAAKMVEVNKQKKRAAMLNRIRRVGTWAVVLAALIVVSQLVWG